MSGIISVHLSRVRGKISTYEIPFVANSVTKMPPPVDVKPGPYDVVFGFVTMQPSLLLSKMEQSVELINVLV